MRLDGEFPSEFPPEGVFTAMESTIAERCSRVNVSYCSWNNRNRGSVAGGFAMVLH